MPEKGKFRLYLTLQHRMGLPGYHWAIMLVPKTEGDGTHQNSHVFHITNSIQAAAPRDDQSAEPVILKGMPDWRYEHKPCAPLRSGTVVARILVAKLPAREPLETTASNIDKILRNVALVQHDKSFTCRVWAENALATLRGRGGNFGTIPQVDNGGDTENDIKTFGDEAMKTLVGRIGGAKRGSDLPVKDMRIR